MFGSHIVILQQFQKWFHNRLEQELIGLFVLDLGWQPVEQPEMEGLTAAEGQVFGVKTSCSNGKKASW